MKKVELKIDIEATPKEIIEAFTDPKILRDWWKVERSLIEKENGGLFSLAWNITEKGFGYVLSGTIKKYNANGLLELDNVVYLNPDRPILGPMTLTVKTTGMGKSTQVYLCQKGSREGTDWYWFHEAVNQAWPHVIETLKTYLEKNKVRS